MYPKIHNRVHMRDYMHLGFQNWVHILDDMHLLFKIWMHKEIKNNPIITALTDDKVLANIQNIQRANQIKPSNKLEGRYNLTIEMETGVG